MMKKRLLLTVCMLCMFATLLFVPALAVNAAQADAVPLADVQNVIVADDGSTLDTALSWTYGDDDIISYTFRPTYGDTAFYAVTAEGQELDKFAVKYIGSDVLLYEVKKDESNNDVADTEKPFRVNSLNAFLKTLTPGAYTLTVAVPSGTNDDGDSYTAASHSVSLTVAAYDITDKVGDSASSLPIKYTVLNPEMLYTGQDNNVPQIRLELTTDNGGKLVLVEGEDYTLSSDSVVVGDADLTITGKGGFTGSVTIAAAYQIVSSDNSVSDVYVVRWKYGEFDKNVNRFTANAKWGADKLYFAVSTDNTGDEDSFVEGLEAIHLNSEGVVSDTVAQLLNTLDAKTEYYLFAIVDGGDNYAEVKDYTKFEVVEVTNTWTTTPNVVSWEWHNFDENVNVINAVPAFGSGVKFSVYTKDGDDYSAIKFDGKDNFELEDGATPASVARALSNLDAGTYYLFASLISDSDNYTSINETFNANALVPFRVLQARNYWTQIPQIANWSYGGYNPEINVISAAAAHGSSGIRYSIYQQTADGKFGVIDFNGASSFKLNAGVIPSVVSNGLKALAVGKYYLRAVVDATPNYTGLQELVADFSTLPSFEVIKAENYWSTAPAITAWAEGKFSNEENLPLAAAHFGTAKIVIVDVDDEENVLYDSENNINNLAKAKVGAYLLTATVAGTANYSELTFDTIFHVFVPETATTGIAWWLVLIIVLCSLGVLVFIFWLLHDKGVLQMLTTKTIVAMRTKATMDATIAAVRANKVAEEAKESIRLAEAIEQLEAEQFENEEDDSDEEVGPILIERDDESGFATFVRYQRPFSVRLIQVSDETKEWYSYLKNMLLSYKKVKSKVSNGYDAFNLGRNQLAKLVIRGKTLCLYLALDPDEYEDTKYRVERSQSKKFAETPCLFRIKSQRRQKYAEELIAQLSEKFAMVQGENQNVDYRPPYESTEELMEKGLIKKIVYKKKFASFVKDNAGASIIVKTEDDSQLKIQEVGAVASGTATENTDNAEGQAENPAPEAEAATTTETEQAPATADETPTETEAPAAEEVTTPTESPEAAQSDQKTNKKQKGAKNHVAKK